MRELIETILLTVIIFFVVRLAVQNFRVDGVSMMNTVKNNDLVLVNKVDYFFSSPHVGDVIVFRPPVPEDRNQDFIKRVIGTPGDTVQIRMNAGVWVNGKKLNEPYLTTSGCPAGSIYHNGAASHPFPATTTCETPNYNWGPAKVPSNVFFVLGDNRNNSFDSHQWCGPNDTTPCSYTWVHRSDIVGKALIAYWPLNHLKFFGF